VNVAEFVEKWRKVELTERSAAQQHFLDLCELLDHPKPAEIDPTGEFFTFEKGATKKDGSDGWADVWKRGYFAWEYKGKHKDLQAAYLQLDQYRAALENPPLLVTCDMDRIVVHSNFTATRQEVHEVPLDGLGTPRNLEILRAVFHAPQKLKPGTTSEAITAEAASHVAEVAVALRERGLPAQDVARFLDRVVFALFAEDIELLPNMVFTRLLERSRSQPGLFARFASELFEAMQAGGYMGLEEIRRFNGNLFEAGPVLELTKDELERLYQAARLDWSAVDPSILGTLFERGMDPDKRSQLGAHYTSREDIEILVEPVVMKPLRREWREVQQLVANLLATGKKHPTGKEQTAPTGPRLRKARTEAQLFLRRFHQRLAQLKILDPACGSGNFLYVSLQKLKDLEKEVILFAMEQGFSGEIPLVGPWQLHGIEASAYAFELAQMTVWIGYLQWTRQNGFGTSDDPVLRPMDNFECKDAVLDRSDPDNPREPEWPKVDFIVGNPPFLGGKKMRSGLGDAYVDRLFLVWKGRVPAEADYVTYWFEKARSQIEQGRAKRAGLLATQGIRGGANREILKRIKGSTEIFFAESDRDWVLEGANVHVSMVGFGQAEGIESVLDGRVVEEIHANLTAAADVTQAKRLPGRAAEAFMADTKGGTFDLEADLALSLLREPNPHGLPNSDVIVPWVNGRDVTDRRRGLFIIDFGVLDGEAAAKYAAPFERVAKNVRPQREETQREEYRVLWWQHVRPRPTMREALRSLSRFLATVVVSKHRLFTWLEAPTLPDHALIAFAFDSDFHMGLLHSRVHEIWARAQGTQVRERESGFRYTPTSCFETFPFPEASAEQKASIAAAAQDLDDLRERWLNPPEWVRESVLEFPGSVEGPWARYVCEPGERGIGTVRYPRLMPKDEEAASELARRTLTNLYNQRPAWLDNGHRKLDQAVTAAYGWPPDLSDEEVLERLLALNLDRAGKTDTASATPLA
jgi:MmeI, DNA-methyltransferase domain/MmeI, N-terminal domain/MmeI, helicase spacer domain/MmeI, target recognition domain